MVVGGVTTVEENLTEMHGGLKNYGKSCNNEEKSANQLSTRDEVTNVNEVAAEGAQVLRKMNHEPRSEFENHKELVHNTQRGECVGRKGWGAVGAVEG